MQFIVSFDCVKLIINEQGIFLKTNSPKKYLARKLPTNTKVVVRDEYAIFDLGHHIYKKLKLYNFDVRFLK